MPVKPVPDGYHAVTPFLNLRDADAVIAFLKKAFDAADVYEPLRRPDGKIQHAEVDIGDSRIMISEECDEAPATVSTLYLYVPDVDRVYRQAIAAGATSIVAPADMFYGDRSGGVRDASGNNWFIATRKEDLSRAEMGKRAEAFFKAQRSKAA